ncbi:MAG: serine/threonine protein kinase, partial [Planctomycetales bacterium]|nr:serine/threonine protein kinase [Planctomycetales bacterium]
FEFIEGQNLRELILEQGPLPVEQALQVTLQVAEALQHAARRDVVHRDIKPSNVLLTPGGKAKLVDMGLARLRPMNTRDGDLTASGVTLGTFDYISPEQARDPRQADVRSDLYSLGCTLYFMLTGQPPFPEGTVLQKLLSHNSEAPPDPRQVRDDLPPELMPIMHRMLAKKPADRYQRPLDLVADLLILAERLGMSTPNRAEAIWVAPLPSRWQRFQLHLPWMVPSVTLLLLAMFWDPAWLDGGLRAEPQPEFQVPQRVNSSSVTGAEVASDDSLGATPPKTTGPATGAVAARSPTGNTIASASAINSTAGGGSALETNDTAATEGGMPVGSESTTSTSAGVDTVAARAARGSDSSGQTGVMTLIVDDSPSLLPGNGELVVSNLEDACRLAMQNTSIDTIEIRKSGRIRLPGLSLKLADRELTLEAGTGYTPILVFQAGGLGDTTSSSHGMLRITGGTLALRGVHVEFNLAREAFEGEWSLFELKDVRKFALYQSTVTVQNSSGERFSNLANVSVFNCLPPTRGDMLDPDVVPRANTTLELNNCIVRCEATMVVAPEAIPLTLSWHNGLLVSSERLLRMGGTGKPLTENEEARIDLQHVTAVVDQGLIEISTSTMRPNLIPLGISSDSSIFVTQRWSSLILQSGARRLAEFMAQVDYRAANTAYEGMETLWKIVPQDGAPTETFDFEVWQSHWGETDPQWKQIRWRDALEKTRPVHEARVADFVLARPEGVGGNDSKSTRGFQQTSLPRLPEPEVTVPKKTRPFYQS